jgi:hypothetical protein
MYVKALVLLLLLSVLIGGIKWGVDSIYDAGGDAREDRLVREWQEEKLALISERDKLREAAETLIAKDRIIYRDRIQKVREVVVDCTLPSDLIGLLRESGVFKAGEVRDATNN